MTQIMMMKTEDRAPRLEAEDDSLRDNVAAQMQHSQGLCRVCLHFSRCTSEGYCVIGVPRAIPRRSFGVPGSPRRCE